MILLDTHVVIWLMTAPERVSEAAAEAIAETGSRGTLPAVSAASIFEIAYNRRRGRIQLHVPETEMLKRMRAWFDLLPVTEAIAIAAADLAEPFHGDPMDRMIVATAMVQGCALLTADGAIRAADICKTIW